jgi:F-box protein, helicase, 18
MELTKEQIEIVNSSGNIKINAVAGSGKTTTIIEYAKSRPKSARILYLAFNKSVKLEAMKKFSEQGLTNVKVETAHSLAYKHIVMGSDYRVKAFSYKTHEISELLGLKGNGEKHNEFVIANHILKFIAFFCNSDKEKIQELNYLDTISDKKARAFVQSFYDYIVKQSRVLLSRMDKGEIEIAHDFYLKKFQLTKPNLKYDYILFDEGQDSSPAMLDIFLNQKATKVIVGDTNQQIYGWRYAVNSLEKADFKTFHLSTSFRFSQDVAKLAVDVLKYKNYLQSHQEIPIAGVGTSKKIISKAVIARTNLGLLLKAIEYVSENKSKKRIYFEGNINSYTYADEGASLYDILKLYNGNHRAIKDNLIKSMKDLEDLEDYIKKTDDVQLGMMVEIVREYGNEIPGIINNIKRQHVENDQKETAEMVFSTVHRCKGMEYDSIQLVNDFINEDKLKKLKEEEKKDVAYLSRLNEEINLLYVAITRTRNSLHIPEALLPAQFPASPHIRVMKVVEEEEEIEVEKYISDYRFKKKVESLERAYSVALVREKHNSAYRPWTPFLDDELTKMHNEGITVKDMAKHFGRTKGAIEARITKVIHNAIDSM